MITYADNYRDIYPGDYRTKMIEYYKTYPNNFSDPERIVIDFENEIFKTTSKFNILIVGDMDKMINRSIIPDDNNKTDSIKDKIKEIIKPYQNNIYNLSWKDIFVNDSDKDKNINLFNIDDKSILNEIIFFNNKNNNDLKICIKLTIFDTIKK
jgi:hypothetical protein